VAAVADLPGRVDDEGGGRRGHLVAAGQGPVSIDDRGQAGAADLVQEVANIGGFLGGDDVDG